MKYLLPLILVLSLGSCHHSDNSNISLTGTHIAKADILVEHAIPDASKTSKPLLIDARAELSAADKSNQQTAKDFSALAVDRDKYKEKFEKLDSAWYVVTYRIIRAVVWILATLGILSWLLATFAGGIWGQAGKWVLSLFHLLPLPNPFPAATSVVNKFRTRNANS